MGIIKNMLKRKNDIPVNSFGEPIDKLVDGDLPWGWMFHNKDFTDKIQAEFEHFRKEWADSRNGDPKEEYWSLKSFLMYIDDLQAECDKKGECFGFWCSQILVGDDWKAKLKSRLCDLEANKDKYEKEYADRLELERKLADFNSTVSDEFILEMIRCNAGILQKDFYKLFDNVVAKEALSERLYWMDKKGKIKRTKQGNSYKLEL